jgi:glycolate oxidase FAD binding subunit
LAEILRPSPGASRHPLPEGEGSIDSIPVSRVVQPESIEELAAIVANEKGAIVPLGARTQTHFGNPLRRADCAIDLSRLQRITEYNPADLTIHVEAGVTLGELQHSLLENNQFLPLDPWNGPEATVAGIAAVNAQGPFRATGTIRDWIIGMKVVEVTGRISKAGGRVVKNVTGYDLQKLYTGSLGTLAIIAEVSLKLRAKFGRTATAIAKAGDTDVAVQLISSLRRSAVQPISEEWVGPDNEIWLRLGEHPRAVEWQLKNLPSADWTILEGSEETAAWEKLRSRYHALSPVTLRVVGLPTAVHEIIKEYRPSAWIAHALNGIVLAQVGSAADIRRIREKYRAVIESAPLEVRREVATFGLDDAEYTLMKKMKDAFDPEGRLNPGRHVDGERNQ